MLIRGVFANLSRLKRTPYQSRIAHSNDQIGVCPMMKQLLLLLLSTMIMVFAPWRWFLFRPIVDLCLTDKPRRTCLCFPSQLTWAIRMVLNYNMMVVIRWDHTATNTIGTIGTWRRTTCLLMQMFMVHCGRCCTCRCCVITTIDDIVVVTTISNHRRIIHASHRGSFLFAIANHLVN